MVTQKGRQKMLWKKDAKKSTGPNKSRYVSTANSSRRSVSAVRYLGEPVGSEG